MASNTNPLGIAPGEKGLAANGTLYASNLGRIYTIDGNRWKIVKAAGALTTMGRATVAASSASSGIPTNVATTSTTASDPLVLGVCHSSQVDLATGDYFLVQGSGYAEVISAAAIAVGVAVGCSTTAKKVDDATILAAGAIGAVLELASAGDENVAIRLNLF
jgi:hypothetical protein